MTDLRPVSSPMNTASVATFLKGLQAVLPAEFRKDEPVRRAELARFFHGLQHKLDAVDRKRVDRQAVRAPDFNPFRYIARNENALSDVVADLLNPNETHGQGPLFLECFLKVARFRRKSRLMSARVEREVPTNGSRRIDILLEFDVKGGRFGIGIENKPWAGEGDGQVQGYLADLKQAYPAGCMVVFLAGRGQKVESLSEPDQDKMDKEDEFRYMSYASHVSNWLQDCLKACRARRVRWFLKEFLEYVADEFVVAEM